MTPPDPDLVVAATAALDEVRAGWQVLPAVVSVEIARRWVDGAPSDEIGIRVAAIDPDAVQRILPTTLAGFRVDVVEGVGLQPED